MSKSTYTYIPFVFVYIRPGAYARVFLFLETVIYTTVSARITTGPDNISFFFFILINDRTDALVICKETIVWSSKLIGIFSDYGKNEG